MKYKRLKNRIKSSLETYKKTKILAEKELFIIIKTIKEEYPHLTQVQLYQEAKKHLVAKEKELNYAGARTIPMTVAVGILLFLINGMVFDLNNKDSIITQLSSFLELVQNTQELKYWIAYYLLLVLVLMPIGVVIAVSIQLVTRNDRSVRKDIYKFNIMNQLIEEKIEKLKK